MCHHLPVATEIALHETLDMDMVVMIIMALRDCAMKINAISIHARSCTAYMTQEW